MSMIDILNFSSLHSPTCSSYPPCELPSCGHIQQHFSCNDMRDLKKEHTRECTSECGSTFGHLLVHQQEVLVENVSSMIPPFQSLDIAATAPNHCLTPSENISFISSMNRFSLPPLLKIPVDRDLPLLLPKLSARPKNPFNSSPFLLEKLKRKNKKLDKSKSLQDIHRIAILQERAVLISRRKFPRPTTAVSIRAPRKVVIQSTSNTSSGGGGGDDGSATSSGSASNSHISGWGRMDFHLRCRRSTSSSNSDLSNPCPSSYYATNVPTVPTRSTAEVDSNFPLEDSHSRICFPNPLLGRDSLPTLFAPTPIVNDNDCTTVVQHPDQFQHIIHTTHEQKGWEQGQDSSLYSDYPELFLDYETLANEVKDDSWASSICHDEGL